MQGGREGGREICMEWGREDGWRDGRTDGVMDGRTNWGEGGREEGGKGWREVLVERGVHGGMEKVGIEGSGGGWRRARGGRKRGENGSIKESLNLALTLRVESRGGLV